MFLHGPKGRQSMWVQLFMTVSADHRRHLPWDHEMGWSSWISPFGRVGSIPKTGWQALLQHGFEWCWCPKRATCWETDFRTCLHEQCGSWSLSGTSCGLLLVIQATCCSFVCAIKIMILVTSIKIYIYIHSLNKYMKHILQIPSPQAPSFLVCLCPINQSSLDRQVDGWRGRWMEHWRPP